MCSQTLKRELLSQTILYKPLQPIRTTIYCMRFQCKRTIPEDERRSNADVAKSR